jgi:hypothetical protein
MARSLGDMGQASGDAQSTIDGVHRQAMKIESYNHVFYTDSNMATIRT